MSAKGELSFTEAEIKLLTEKNKELAPHEFEAFLEACKRYQLNPLANQIYCRLQRATGRSPRQVTYTTGIDGYRLIADRTGHYAGNDDAIYDKELHPEKATVIVWKMVDGQRCPFSASARMEQYKPKPPADFMWRQMPHLMLGKCAEALALRKAFPAQLAGLYTKEEMEQADNEPQQDVPDSKELPHARSQR